MGVRSPAPPQPMSLSFSELDCPARMFLVSVCLNDVDLAQLGFHRFEPPACVSRTTAGRTALHRMGEREPAIGSRVSDLLDLRHAAAVGYVRSSEGAALEPEVQDCAREGEGEQLAAWAWALLTDPREEVQLLGRRLMGECYVRGMRRLAEPQPVIQLDRRRSESA